MKKLLIVLAVFVTASVFAQAPQKMSYQAVIRNGSSALITSTTVGMQISILQGSVIGTPVYVETQTPTSNINGLVSLEIGTGITSDDFSIIDWSNGPYFIKTETDPIGGTNYTITGTSELLSVPYALHAKTAENIVGGISETDPIFGVSVASGITGADITNWNNKLDTEIDGSVTNELQAISLSNDTIYLSNGGFVKLPVGFDGQYSSLTGTPSNVSSFTNDAGYLTSFSEVDGSITNELQVLSISNDTLYLSDGGFVKIPSANAWSLTGNTGTTDGVNFIGTTDNVPLNLKVNNQKAGRIDQAGSTILGYQAGNVNLGIQNTIVGFQSMYSNTIGYFNSTNGYQTLYNNTTGYSNVANGWGALYLNTTGYNNTASGVAALTTNTTGYDNTAVGLSALRFNTTGVNNTAMGSQSLIYNTTGHENTAVGVFSLFENTIGTANTAFGYAAMNKNISGGANTAIGYDALFYNTTGNENTATGRVALHFNTTGVWNTATGSVALMNNTTGNNNTAVGYGSLFSNTTGNNNTAIGWTAGNLNETGSGNVFIGYEAGFNETGSNKLYIANSSTVTPLIYGDFTTGYVGIGTNNPTEKLVVVGNIPDGRIATFDCQTCDDRLITLGQVLTDNGGYVKYKKSSNYTGIGVHGHTEQLIVNGSGNVGIGTISPTAKLQVETYGFSNKTIWGINSMLIQNQTPGSRTLLALAPNGTQNADLVIFHNSDYTTNYESLSLGYENTLNNFTIGTSKGGTGTQRRLVLDATGAPTNLWNQLVLATNGNIGIGNSNPSAKLHIGNGTRFVASSDASIFLQSGNGAGSSRDWKIYVPMTAGYLAFRDMGFDNLNNGMATDAMAIQYGTGNVGIGTTNPSAKLEVQGAVKIVDGTQSIGKVLTSDANGLASWQTPSTNSHYIGESYGGGIVFYVYDNGQHGLIASTADQASLQWYNGTYRYTGTTGDGLGAGAMNTALIVATQISDNQTGNFAAKVCADYSVTVGGITYGDWYLPSKYELNLLYLEQGVVGGFAPVMYWSSLELDGGTAWNQSFSIGNQGNPDKATVTAVRAIRVF